MSIHLKANSISEPGPAAAPIPATVYVLTGAIAVIGCNSLVLSPIAPAVAAAFGVPVPAVMAGTGAFGLGTAGSALLLARHIDRVGAWRILRLAFALLAAALALSAAAPAVPVLVAAQLAAGIAAGLSLPAIYANAAAIAPPGREGRTVGIVLTGWTISMVAGVSLSAVLADMLNWRAVFAVVACLALLGLVALIVGGQEDRKASAPATSPLAALATPGLLPLLAANGAFMTAFYGTYSYLGDHLHQSLGLPLSAGGLTTLAYGLGFGAAAFLDRAGGRVPARMALPMAFSLVLAVYVLLSLAAHIYAALLAVAFVWGVANHLGLNLLIVRLTAIDPARRGGILGLNSAVTYLAAFAGSVAFGPLYLTGSFPDLALAAAVLMAVSVAATWPRGADQNARPSSD